jgi:hypothetical protein
LGNKVDQDENKTRLTENKDLPNHDQDNHSKLVATQWPQVSPTRKYQSTLKTNGAMPENTLVLGGAPLQPQPILTSNENDNEEPMAVVPLKADVSVQINSKFILIMLYLFILLGLLFQLTLFNTQFPSLLIWKMNKVMTLRNKCLLTYCHKTLLVFISQHLF